MSAGDLFPGLRDVADVQDVLTFSADGRKTWHLNASKEWILLREPSPEECSALLSEFRKISLPWVADALCEPNRAKSHVIGLSGNITPPQKGIPSKEHPVHWAPSKISLRDVPSALWDLFSGTTAEHEARNMLLSRAPLSEQEAFVRAFLTGSPERIFDRLKSAPAHRYVNLELEKALEQAASGRAFVEAIARLALREARIITTRADGKRPPDADSKSAIPILFMLFLAGKGIALLPIESATLPAKDDGAPFELWRRLLDERHSSLTKNASGFSNLSKSDAKQVSRLALAFCGISSFDSDCLACSEAFEKLREIVVQRGVTQGRKAEWKVDLLYNAVRPEGGKPLLIMKPRADKTETVCPECGEKVYAEYAWTARSEGDVSGPDYVPAEYHAACLPSSPQSVGHFAHVLDDAIQSKGNIRISPEISKLRKFLGWVAWRLSVGEPITTSVDCVPVRNEVAENDDELQTSLSLRAWLYRTFGPDGANDVLNHLSETFRIQIRKARPNIDESAVDSVNPVRPKLDLFRSTKPMPTKTTRTPIPRNVMSALAKANKEDDYALSRGNPEHERFAFDPELGRYRKMWFPGFALLIDLLMTLPIRSFQARFLDSGELDETRHFVAGRTITSKRNAKGKKNRSEGVIRPFRSITGETVPGLHINTNKTGLKANGSYEIPWASDEILALINRMREWQERHNPNPKLVPCAEKVEMQKYKERKANIETILKQSGPLFRDPADKQGFPVTKNALDAHWVAVNRAAEKALSEAGHNVELVYRTVDKNGREAQRAVYDIHTLRVTGISNLIELGLSPDLVQEIAGHSSIAMTLYYKKLRHGELERRLSEAMAKLSDIFENPSSTPEDFARESGGLFNSRNSDLPNGMLANRRTRMGGAVMIFTHGVCPGGDCNTGGEKGEPLPRAEACSICRYRLTGPAFLPGLVQNSNVMLGKLREIGLEIKALNSESRKREDEGKSSAALQARVEALFRESEIVSREWGAEVQYAMLAQEWLNKTSADAEHPPVLYGAEIEGIRIEQVAPFELAQRLAEGGILMPGSCPPVALRGHREYINELLTASNIDPILLRLKGEQRDRAAALLGRALTSLVPMERHEEIREGRASLEDFPMFGEFLTVVRERVGSDSLDWDELTARLENKEGA